MNRMRKALATGWLRNALLSLMHHPVPVIVMLLILAVAVSWLFYPFFGEEPAIIAGLLIFMSLMYLAHFAYFSLAMEKSIRGFELPNHEFIWKQKVVDLRLYRSYITDQSLTRPGKTFAIVILILVVPFLLGMVANVGFSMPKEQGVKGLEYLKEMTITALIVMITVEFSQLLSLNNRNYEYLSIAVMVTLAMDVISLFIVSLSQFHELADDTVMVGMCRPLEVAFGLFGGYFPCERYDATDTAKFLMLIFFLSFAISSAFILIRVRVVASHRELIMERVMEFYDHWPLSELPPVEPEDPNSPEPPD